MRGGLAHQHRVDVLPHQHGRGPAGAGPLPADAPARHPVAAVAHGPAVHGGVVLPRHRHHDGPLHAPHPHEAPSPVRQQVERHRLPVVRQPGHDGHRVHPLDQHGHLYLPVGRVGHGFPHGPSLLRLPILVLFRHPFLPRQAPGKLPDLLRHRLRGRGQRCDHLPCHLPHLFQNLPRRRRLRSQHGNGGATA